MGRTTELRRAVADAFLPVAEAAGFRPDRRRMPATLTFRRTVGGQVQILEIQWEKYGRPRFVLDYGACPGGGFAIDGRIFPPEEVFAGWLPGSGRLKPGRGLGPGAWFRQDRTLLQRLVGRGALRPATEVAAELLALFPEVLRALDDGVRGPHITPLQP
ncbi:hypothetical protein [Neoroseomonas oryzicola]|uniref:DUF4304 domain-containing protein n=1 Tax=Neoroseomonas oryzicola TaxID=535904 RepID=A0A9X9WEN3_9PROT|nr:hypothetical protein [Neoroseomonas oryzicola]MBR0658793.1 hypothetical protein [Neoroseomonas oryzicola]NKE17271.1 hypothetical protein [Neoroseomonas oryzicola]